METVLFFFLFKISKAYLWLVALFIFLLALPAPAQDILWGLTSEGGPKGAGTVFSINSNELDFTLQHTFGYDPSRPTSSLTPGDDGYLYGMTNSGGYSVYGYGTIFKIMADGSDFTVLHSFNPDTEGTSPRGSLLKGSDGDFYGMTPGTIFKISSDGAFTILNKFNGSWGSLIEGEDGIFYGMTSEGGFGYGTIFSFTANGSTFKELYSFNKSTDGANPHGDLMLKSDGYLYGMTRYGGISNKGTIFKIAIDGSNFKVIYNFNSFTDGFSAQGSLIEGTDGYLYGMTSQGGNPDDNSEDDYDGYGTIFKINAEGTDFKVLKRFNGSTDGSNPRGSLIEATDGSFYGMTSQGGINWGGTIFKITPIGSNFTVLKSFVGFAEGGNPQGSLVRGENGYFYGTTSYGGSNGNGYGTLFKIAPNASDFKVLHQFVYSSGGARPYGSLTEDREGNFYGMTSRGGINGDLGGVIFKIIPTVQGYKTIKIFDLGYWDNPHGSLVVGKDGYLYGMTLNGSVIGYGYGTIFKIAPDGSNFTVLKYLGTDYYGRDQGTHPLGSLIEGTDGNFYGMTSEGGTAHEPGPDPKTFGVIFKITPTGEFTVLKSFNVFNGSHPSGDLIEGEDGYFYGITPEGGNYRGGTIFRIASDGTGFKVLNNFDPLTDGYQPTGSLVQGQDGYLYGMTSKGGDLTVNGEGYGVLFKMDTDGSDYTILKKFNGYIDGNYFYSDGIYPHGSLSESSDGTLYGMTSQGGDYGAGTIFRINPNGTGHTVLKSLNAFTDGATPVGSLIIQKGKKTMVPALQVNFQDKNTKTPADWLKDYGLAFGEKTIGDSTLTYGWKQRSDGIPVDLSIGGPFPGNGRWRPAPADPLLATLMHMQGNDITNFRGTPVESYWELAVENGEYLVTVSVGDGLRYTYSDPESHSINVEGMPAITNFVPQGSNGSLTRFKQATVKVKVEDGNLTLDADGGTNTKINYAIIQPLSGSAAIARKDFSAQGEEMQAQIKAYPNPFANSLTLTMPQWQGQVKLSLNNVVGMNLYTTQQEIRAGEISLNLSGLELTPGIYVLKLTAEDGTTKLLKIYRQ